MAKQVINIGTSEQAGDGEALRSAFNKVNSNFTELYNDDAADFDGAFASLTGTPTTIAGYGITDALALGITGTTALAGDTALLALGTTGTTALAGDTAIPSALTDLGITDGTANQVLTTDGSGNFTFATGGGLADTDALSEGTTNLYYTDARADARAQIKIDALVDTAPGTMDTLNELAAALGDDPNFATTTATSIAEKLPLAGGTMTGAIDMGSNNITTTGKMLFANMYATEGDLPSATTYHGMFAHVHGTGAGYFAHGGNWVKLANYTDLSAYQTTGGLGGNIDLHLNQSNPTSGYVLSWNGSDYAWVAQSGGGGGSTWAGITDINNVSGPTEVAIGKYAGTSQGNNAIAIGNEAGQSGQGTNAVAIGWQAGESAQSSGAVAYGQYAGQTSQSGNAVAIGQGAGNHQQGGNAIAIGQNAGAVSQAANSIVLNASSSTVNNTVADSFVVKPIRNAVGTTVMMYDATTGEVTHSSSLKLDVGVEEKFSTHTGSTGVVTQDCSTAALFYHTGATADFTVNFTNINSTAEYAKALAVIVTQGGTGYIPSAVQIGGVAQTIEWQGNSAPTATANGVDTFSFTIMNDGGTYMVLGQMTSFGGV